MPYISKITLPSGTTYSIKDAEAREMIAGGVSFIVAWDGKSTPVIADIPAGVKVVYGGTEYTGTLSAETSASTPEPHAKAGSFYLVHSADTTRNVFAEYVPVGVDGSKYWEKIGDSDIDLSDYAKKGDGITGTAANKVTGISISNHSVTNGQVTSTGSYTPSAKPTLSASSSTNAVVVATGGSNSASNVTFTGSTAVYSMTSAGSVDPGTANVPTVINTAKFSGGSYSHNGFSGGSGSYTQGAFNGGSFTQGAKASWTGTVSNEILTIGWTTNGNDTFVPATHGDDTHSHTAAVYGTDSFTGAAIQDGFYTPGSAGTPTSVTLPGRSSAINALTTSTTAQAAAQAFTPTTKYLNVEGIAKDVSVTGTTNVSVANHTITDSGHTHSVSGTINS